MNPNFSVDPIRIVTDSGAHFPHPGTILKNGVTVVPNMITVAGKTMREGIDLSAEEAIRAIVNQPFAPILTPPTIQAYLDTYRRLAGQSRAILSIHTSKVITQSFQNAKAAAQLLAGHCPIIVIDSQTLSAGLGLLVEAAAREVDSPLPLDEIVRRVRGAVERIYSVYFAESTDYLMHNGLLEPSHAILGGMMGIKPILTIENGVLATMEKVRTRTQAVERLVEFAVEFSEFEAAVIVQNRVGNSESSRMLQERLIVDFPDRPFAHVVYGASLAAFIGTDALGLVILERESEEENDEL